MGDYRDIIEAARQSGFTLDACGSSERYYTWGSFIDLCGMSVEEYMKAPAYSGGGGGQGDSSASTKTKNTITLSMQEGSDGTNHIKVSAEKVSDSDVIVSFNVEGVGTQVVTIPAGSKEVVTSISLPAPSRQAKTRGTNTPSRTRYRMATSRLPLSKTVSRRSRQSSITLMSRFLSLTRSTDTILSIQFRLPPEHKQSTLPRRMCLCLNQIRR